MNDWASGYVSDIGYTYGYYTELNPLRVKLAFLNAGIVAPDIINACELGFGQGLSANLHAAASTIKWSGTDFNPAQASYAQDLAKISEAEARLYDESFEQFSQRTDLPEFDYIGLHGIWSWISDENRSVIVDFIQRKLKVGGVLYISYNTQPGLASMVPMRDLLAEHARILGIPGHGSAGRIATAMSFVDELISVKPLFMKAHPQLEAKFSRLKNQDASYLAHEYFNKDWEPMAFSAMLEWLKPTKLEWACSANYIDAVDSICITNEHKKFIETIPDKNFKQTIRDYCVNQQFRKDYWVKGLRNMTPLDREESLRRLKIILGQPKHEITLKIVTSLGEATMNSDIYQPILNLLGNYKIWTIGQLEDELAKQEAGRIKFDQILEAIIILSGTGALQLAQDAELIKKIKKKTDSINHHLMMSARSSADVSYLASPVTGGGIPVRRIHQLFLLSKLNGAKTPDDLAGYVWKIFAAQGMRLTKNGVQMNSAEENIKRLKELAIEFAENDLPLLNALQIA